MTRSRYKITFIDPKIVTTKEKNMYDEDIEVRYRMLRAVDGTSFGNEPIVFTGACPADDDYRVNDIISGEIRDPRQPLYLHEIAFETRHAEPALLVEPEPIELPEPPTSAVVESQDWRYALMNNQFLAPIDVLQMAQALARLEGRVKRLESVKS